jgi:FKBP-type peptidyl-prolyl cis-trans isomerase SlpA
MSDNNLAIGSGTQITLHFSLKLASGELIDSTFDKEPAMFVVGDGQLLPGFEEQLIGLQAGAEKSFEILPEKGFGMPNPNNRQVMSVDMFSPDMELSEGLVVSFADANKQELPGVIASIDEGKVEVDFNHPLAGKDLVFDVKILTVDPVKVGD